MHFTRSLCNETNLLFSVGYGIYVAETYFYEVCVSYSVKVTATEDLYTIRSYKITCNLVREIAGDFIFLLACNYFM